MAESRAERGCVEDQPQHSPTATRFQTPTESIEFSNQAEMTGPQPISLGFRASEFAVPSPSGAQGAQGEGKGEGGPPNALADT
jgi:hypothetical protein